MKNRKLVLISETGYDKKHDEFLASVLDQGYELFCIVGVQCELWEDMMDAIAARDRANPRHITMTSHPGEDEGEVIEFAEMFVLTVDSGVDIVRV